MLEPRIMPKVKQTIYLDENVLDILKILAEQEVRSIPNLVESFIVRELRDRQQLPKNGV